MKKIDNHINIYTRRLILKYIHRIMLKYTYRLILKYIRRVLLSKSISCHGGFFQCRGGGPDHPDRSGDGVAILVDGNVCRHSGRA